MIDKNKGLDGLGVYINYLTMKNLNQILMLFVGIIVAALLIAANLRNEEMNANDVIPTSQKKPHPPTSEQGLFDSLLKN